MSKDQVISRLLQSSQQANPNIELLKKIILTASMGRLLINGQSPDVNVSLSDYLFDNERFIIDLSRLSSENKEKFENWLLKKHAKGMSTSLLSSASVDEYRGYTAEERLNWFGVLKRFLFGPSVSTWKINDFDVSLDYQLLGIEATRGENGILIGFNAVGAASHKGKYQKTTILDSHEYMGNTKRVVLTDQDVLSLLNNTLNSKKIQKAYSASHPLSIRGDDVERRYQCMREYRESCRFLVSKPWYIKLIDWFLSWFTSKEKEKKHEPAPSASHTLREIQLSNSPDNETVKLYRIPGSKRVLVYEKRPNIENVVLCGGGPKIYGHIGFWKSLTEKGIAPRRFAGTSAGAIISLCCYLGFQADEMYAILRHLKQEHVVNFNLDRNGISDSGAFKTAIDYVIALKVKEITNKYHVAFPSGKITFRTLAELKKRFPDCGIADELIVTGTSIKDSKTVYFCLKKTPDVEVSRAVTASASIPLIFKGSEIEGSLYSDGGMLNNFPTDAFHGESDTLLESEDWNNLKALAVQFDTGDARKIVAEQVAPVHRENFLLNWLASTLSGVKDPASGWERDRLKLRKYAAQSVLIDVSELSGMRLTPDDETQTKLINSGYISTNSYIESRYDKINGVYENLEQMHAIFESLEELLMYCCYRRKQFWFNEVANLLLRETPSSALGQVEQNIKSLRKRYFTEKKQQQKEDVSSPAFFNHVVNSQFVATKHSDDCEVLLALFPIMLKLRSEFVKTKADKNELSNAHHAFRSDAPFNCLKYLGFIRGETHVILQIFINLANELKNGQKAETYQALKMLREILYGDYDLTNDFFYGDWNLTTKQSINIIELIKNKNAGLESTCMKLKSKDPLLTRHEEVAPEVNDEIPLEHDKSWMWSPRAFI